MRALRNDLFSVCVSLVLLPFLLIVKTWYCVVMAPCVLYLLAALLSVYCQERPENFASIYDVAPYKQVYPPTRLNDTQCKPDSTINKICPLFILLIMSFGGSFTSSGVVPAIQVALDQINARPDLLPGYSLHYTLLDSQVSKEAQKKIKIKKERKIIRMPHKININIIKAMMFGHG